MKLWNQFPSLIGLRRLEWETSLGHPCCAVFQYFFIKTKAAGLIQVVYAQFYRPLFYIWAKRSQSKKLSLPDGGTSHYFQTCMIQSVRILIVKFVFIDIGPTLYESYFILKKLWVNRMQRYELDSLPSLLTPIFGEKMSGFQIFMHTFSSIRNTPQSQHVE